MELARRYEISNRDAAPERLSFPREVVACVGRAYHRFALSAADGEDLFAERGVTVSRETVRKLMNRVGRHFADYIKCDCPAVADKGHLDEVVVRINGVRQWFRRAVDANGDVLDILVQPRRNSIAATR
jgi:putative transposase